MRNSLLCFLLFLSIFAGGGLFAENTQVDLNALLHETQQMVSNSSKITLIWWIPEEYWRVSLSDSPNVTKEQVEEFLTAFRSYLLIAVVDGKIGLTGLTFIPEDGVRPNLQISDVKGTRYKPLSNLEVGTEAKNFLSMMRPVLSNAMGQMGENMSFFFFPASDKDGKKIAEATSGGEFAVYLGEKKFGWRLPLGSLLPAKTCPIDGEHLSGAWKFCPWHGAELKK